MGLEPSVSVACGVGAVKHFPLAAFKLRFPRQNAQNEPESPYFHSAAAPRTVQILGELRSLHHAIKEDRHVRFK